jgi:hypothetical protein
MARVTKSLQAPAQGYRHRDHRSAKGRSQKKGKAHRKMSIAFRSRKQEQAELSKITQADIYDLEMTPIRNKWKLDRW